MQEHQCPTTGCLDLARCLLLLLAGLVHPGTLIVVHPLRVLQPQVSHSQRRGHWRGVQEGELRLKQGQSIRASAQGTEQAAGHQEEADGPVGDVEGGLLVLA